MDPLEGIQDLPQALRALRSVLDVADAYEAYAAVCDRDGERPAPVGPYWQREAAHARMVTKRIREAAARSPRV